VFGELDNVGAHLDSDGVDQSGGVDDEPVRLW
jgi:hypothetical protein